MTSYTMSSTPAVPDTEDNEARPPLIELLATLGIVEVTYNLDGAGDSGECELDNVRYADGREEAHLPTLPIGFLDDGEILLLDQALEDIAADLPEGNWYDNDGGYGTVRFFPMEICPGDRIVCDMTFRDGDDYEVEDDEEFDELDPPEDSAAGAEKIALIDFDLSQEGAAQ